MPGVSVRFPKGADDKWTVENGENIRTIHRAGLREISVTAFPAYPQTTCEARSVVQLESDRRQFLLDAIEHRDWQRQLDERRRQLLLS